MQAHTQFSLWSSKCFNSVALSMKGELVHPNKTTLKRYVHKGLSRSLGSDSHRNLVTSLSFSSSWMCRNAFSMSLDTAYLPFLNRISISETSVTSGGVDSKQSFRQGESADCRQLQSYTILIGVVEESFFKGDVECNERGLILGLCPSLSQ